MAGPEQNEGSLDKAIWIMDQKSEILATFSLKGGIFLAHLRLFLIVMCILLT